MVNNDLRSSFVIRWLILGLISYVMAANYYLFDAFSPLLSILEEKLSFTSADFGIMQSFYSFPNTFLLMCIFGGIILDKWGIRKTGLLFTLFMVIGSFIMAYGVSGVYLNHGPGYGFFSSFLTSYSPELKIMCFGQLIFGLGAETSIVVISKIIVKWFKGREIALAFAINLAIARIGSFSAFRISTRIINSDYGWTMAAWLTTILLLIGLLFFLFYMLVDVKLDKQMDKLNEILPEEKFEFSDIFDLAKNRSFIFITLLCVTFYSAVFPFLKYASDFFLNKFQLSITTSGDITSYIYIGAIVFTPVFGAVIDNWGKGASLMFYGSALLIMVYAIFAFTGVDPRIPIFFLGVAFSLIPAAMWPAVAKIVDESKIGTAYGVMFAIQNLGLWGFPILAGKIVTNTPKILLNGEMVKDYTYTIIMFGSLGILGLIFSFLLKREDKVSNFGLELPNKKKKSSD